jgi:hypothetical protein
MGDSKEARINRGLLEAFTLFHLANGPSEAIEVLEVEVLDPVNVGSNRHFGGREGVGGMPPPLRRL